MPAAKDVGEPCAGEPHARFEVAAGGTRHQSATAARRRRLPPTLQRRLHLLLRRRPRVTGPHAWYEYRGTSNELLKCRIDPRVAASRHPSLWVCNRERAARKQGLPANHRRTAAGSRSSGSTRLRPSSPIWTRSRPSTGSSLARPRSTSGSHGSRSRATGRKLLRGCVAPAESTQSPRLCSPLRSATSPARSGSS